MTLVASSYLYPLTSKLIGIEGELSLDRHASLAMTAVSASLRGAQRRSNPVYLMLNGSRMTKYLFVLSSILLSACQCADDTCTYNERFLAKAPQLDCKRKPWDPDNHSVSSTVKKENEIKVQRPLLQLYPETETFAAKLRKKEKECQEKPPSN